MIRKKGHVRVIVHSLRKNKKLALSVALNVLFAFALLALFYYVYPQLIYELDSVNNIRGRCSIRTYRKDFGSAYFEVVRGYRRLYSGGTRGSALDGLLLKGLSCQQV